MEIIREVAMFVGLGSSSVGMTGIVSTTNERTRVLGAVTIVVGVVTLMVSRLDIVAG